MIALNGYIASSLDGRPFKDEGAICLFKSLKNLKGHVGFIEAYTCSVRYHRIKDGIVVNPMGKFITKMMYVKRKYRKDVKGVRLTAKALKI